MKTTETTILALPLLEMLNHKYGRGRVTGACGSRAYRDYPYVAIDRSTGKLFTTRLRAGDSFRWRFVKANGRLTVFALGHQASIQLPL